LKDIVITAREKQRGVLQIGVLAPISGDQAEIGKSVVQGVQLAIEQAVSTGGIALKAIVLDTKGNMIETARRTRELLDDHRVPLIIGPVLSQTATVCAAMVTGKPTVMLSPTATDDGIASLGNNVFQMNVTLGVLGRRVAAYAIENLNIREFAIVAPNTSYGKVLAESFKDELRRKNIELTAEFYYEEGLNDYSDLFLDLRSKLLAKQLEKSALYRGLDIKNKVSRADSIKYADSTLAVGGLFMPGDADDIVMLAPQATFHRIRTQLLGANGWNNPKVIQDGKRYVVNAVLSTTSELNYEKKEWQDFKKAYKARYNAEPDRVAAYGYDAGSLVVKAIKEVGGDPVRIAEALGKVQGYSGVSSSISFDREQRVNREATILKVSESGFLRLQ
jgi:ABC-type branched-subunit amino acid transport system substrate-binding protein